MGTYKFLEHTADEKIAIEASNYEDAFKTAVTAMHEILLGNEQLKKVKQNYKKEIILENKKLTTLLYDFINEFILFFDEEDLLLPYVTEITIKKEENIYKLNAKVSGDKRKNYQLLTQIKNMTYSDMKIEEKNNKIYMEIVLDI
jgi:SHS2 domain-containing protein